MDTNPPQRHRPSRQTQLERLITRLDRRIRHGERQSRWMSRGRLALFLVAVAVCLSLYQAERYTAGNASLGLFVALFSGVASYHTRVEARLKRLRHWRGIKDTHLARITLAWDRIPFHTVEEPDRHPYADDLDLVGRHSLFHLLDTTLSTGGRERLLSWLLEQHAQPLTGTEWAQRQAFVKELTGLPLLRDRLILEAVDGGGGSIDTARIGELLRGAIGIKALGPLVVLMGALATVTLTLLIGFLVAGIPGYWGLSFVTYAVIYLALLGRTAPIFGRAVTLQQELEQVGRVFKCLERRLYTGCPILADVCIPFRGEAERPSTWIRRLARTYGALSIRAHPLVQLAINAVVPWDLAWTWRFERLRHHLAQRLETWMDRLATIEAGSALGNLAFLNPDYTWPRLHGGDGTTADTTPGLTARAIGHPLIPSTTRITNDLELRAPSRLMLVTGSNMSGKSTFLRTVGINICLAQAGAPVCATSLEWTWSRLYCCIRVTDSLESGLSYFYAEVKRLRDLLDAARHQTRPPVCFLIDEIFKGTNNRERLIGSRAFIRELARSNGYGLVTTHDLELATLEKELPDTVNVHFQETVAEKALQFDYRLRQGPCPTTNALRIMEIEGLPISYENGQREQDD